MYILRFNTPDIKLISYINNINKQVMEPYDCKCCKISNAIITAGSNCLMLAGNLTFSNCIRFLSNLMRI